MRSVFLHHLGEFELVLMSVLRHQLLKLLLSEVVLLISMLGRQLFRLKF